MSRRGRRSKQDFWRAWHDAHGGDGPPRSGPQHHRGRRKHGRDRAQKWRAFFHQQMGEYPENHWAFRGRRFNPWRQGEDRFNPFVASMLNKGGGLLPLLVLHILADGGRYGNEIMEQIAQKTHGQWIANPGAIYPLMTVLEEEGLITGQWEDPRKRTVRIYEITDKGRTEMQRIRAIVKPKLEEALDVLDALCADLNGDEETTTMEF